jgi:predicted permease
VLERLATLPGVRSAAATSDPELANTNWRANITIAGLDNTTIEDKDVEWELVSAGYCSTLKLPLIAGREINEDDVNNKRGVTVVSENLATHYFGTPQNAIGHYIASGAGNVKTDIEIIGVIKDSKHTTLRGDIRRMVLVPYTPTQQSIGMTFYVRTWQSPESTEASIRQAMTVVDSKLVLDGFHTMQEQIDNSLTDERMIAMLASGFGITALLMAGIGIYGVLAYSTAQRTREIGIRIALGATRITVIRMVVVEVFWLIGIGIAVGLPLSLLVSRTIRSQLFGISNNDPWTLCIGVFLVAALAFVSAALPARRAAKVDPMVALRYE